MNTSTLGTHTFFMTMLPALCFFGYQDVTRGYGGIHINASARRVLNVALQINFYACVGSLSVLVCEGLDVLSPAIFTARHSAE